MQLSNIVYRMIVLLLRILLTQLELHTLGFLTLSLDGDSSGYSLLGPQKKEHPAPSEQEAGWALELV
jgi:hypothetical protein